MLSDFWESDENEELAKRVPNVPARHSSSRKVPYSPPTSGPSPQDKYSPPYLVHSGKAAKVPKKSQSQLEREQGAVGSQQAKFTPGTDAKPAGSVNPHLQQNPGPAKLPPRPLRSGLDDPNQWMMNDKRPGTGPQNTTMKKPGGRKRRPG